MQNILKNYCSSLAEIDFLVCTRDLKGYMYFYQVDMWKERWQNYGMQNVYINDRGIIPDLTLAQNNNLKQCPIQRQRFRITF